MVRIIVNDELARMWKEDFMVYVKEIYQHLPGGKL
jgi:hypothetical protein